MNFPNEIIEIILRKCDGKTLLNCRKVDKEWKNIVDYLTERTEIWKWRCLEEIPKNELIEYLQNYRDADARRWLSIYVNWYSWEDAKSVNCDIIRSPVEVTRISCIAVSNEFISVGTCDGRLKVYNTHWDLIYQTRMLAVKISSLSFIESERFQELNRFCLVIAFHKGLRIFYHDGYQSDYLMIQDVKSHSVYKNYICYEKVGGRLTIAKLNTSSLGGKKLVEIWFSRIYSPSSLSCMRMWEGVCTFLINNEVKIIEYESTEVGPMDIMKKKTRIKFNFPLVDRQHTQILRDDVIISLCKNDEDVKCDFIEFFLLWNEDKYSKKMFNTWEIFRSYITCIYLYGNTLLLGMDVGTVYIYHVSCWKNLDIRNYSHQLIIGKHPITGIAVKETQNERRFYITSKQSVHEITGFLPNIY